MIRRTFSRSAIGWVLGETPRALPARFYSVTVAALAVFFVGLTIWRTPVVGYVVMSEVAFSGAVPAFFSAGNSSPRPGATQTEENTRQQIADAIREANRQLAAERGAAAPVRVAEEQIRWVQQRLAVKSNGRSGPETRMQVLFQGTDLPWSLVLVDTIVRRMLIAQATGTHQHTAAARMLREAKWRVEQSRHYERKARFDLEDALNAHLEQLADGAARTVDRPTPAMDRDRTPVVSSLSSQTLNPNWERLQDEFAQLTGELQDLLQTVTANHPRVRDVTLQMDAIRQQLESTSKFEHVSSSHSLTSAAKGLPLGRESGGGQGPPAAQEQVAGAVERATNCVADASGYQYWRGRYDKTIHDREQAERELSAMMARQQASFGNSSPQVGNIIRPATLVQRVGGRPSSRSVLLIGLTAILVGGVVSWGGGILRDARFIQTVSDLQRVVALPVVSQISLDPTPAPTRRLLAWGRVMRWTTGIGELVLGGMVLLFLWQALSNSSTAQQLTENPLGTFVNLVAEAVLCWF